MTQENRQNNPRANTIIESPALKRLRETLNPLCQDNPVAMCLTNRKGQVFHANQSFLDTLEKELTLDTLMGRSLHSLFSHHSHRVINHIEMLINNKKSDTLQKIIHVGREHTPTAIQARVQILYNPDDNLAEGALITFQENVRWYRANFEEEKQYLTTRIRELSADLMDRQSLLKAMMDHSPFGIALLDNKRRVIQLNHTAEKILGIPRNKARGILCNNLFQCFEHNQRCPILEDQQNINRQETVSGQPGKQQYTFLRSAVRSRERNEDIIIEAFIDVTDMKGAQQAKDAAYKAKDDFFAKMSHELRTPLNAVIGYSELLVDDSFPLEPGELQKYAGAIQRGGYDLLHLVDQVLEISKLRDDKVNNEPLDFHPKILMEEVINTIQPLANKNHNKLSILHDDSVGTVYADPEHLRAIFLNLLSNACKFTKHGDITFSAQRETGTGTKEAWVLFHIHDSGIGLTEEQIGRVFNRFEQADNSSTRSYGGSGLGLSIAKNLCELMGGNIQVKSELGKGSTFTVKLPAQQPS